MAIFVFYFKLIVAIYILFKLISRSIVDRREKNPMLLFVVSFVVVIDVRNILQDSIPQSTVYELAVLFFLFYFLTRLVGENAKSNSLMRNFIDLKAFFESEIVDNFSEGVALLRSDTLEVLASNRKYKAVFNDNQSFIGLPEIVSALMRDEHIFELIDFSNQKREVEARLVPFGTRYALLYLTDVTEARKLSALTEKIDVERQNLWDNAPHMVMLRAFSGKIIYANNLMCDFLYISKQLITDKVLSDIYFKEEERQTHLDIHEKLVSGALTIYKGHLKITYSHYAKGFMRCEEQVITYKGEPVILTTAVNITSNIYLELVQSSFAYIHQKAERAVQQSYVVVDLIHFDMLFKERIKDLVHTQIASLEVFIDGMSEADGAYFMDVISGRHEFKPHTVIFDEKYHFGVEHLFISQTGGLIGVALRILNAQSLSFSMMTIGGLVINHIKEGIAIIDADGKIEFTNEMLQRILNYTREEIESMTIMDVSMGLTKDIFLRNLSLSKQHGSLHFERVYLTKEGYEVPAEVIAMHFPSEMEDKLLLVIRDISEKFIYKKRLIDSQSRYAQIFESLQDDVLEIRLPDKTVSFYREFDAEKGLIGMELSFLQWLNAINDQDRSIVYEAIDIITSEQSDKHQFEYRYFRNNGWQWYRATGRYMQSADGASIILINQNITEIKSITNKLVESRSILVASERIAGMAHWKFNVSKSIFTVSETFGDLVFGSEISGDVYFDQFLESLNPSDVPYFEFKFKRFIWNEESLDIVIRLQKHGKTTFINLIGQVFCDDEGLPIYAIGNITDVTEKTISKQQFEESRLLLEHVVEQTAMGIVVLRNNNSIEKINHVALKLLGAKGASLENAEDLNAHFKKRFEFYYVDSFSRLFDSKESSSVTAVRDDVALKLTSVPMKDADGKYLGRILNVEELH